MIISGQAISGGAISGDPLGGGPMPDQAVLLTPGYQPLQGWLFRAFGFLLCLLAASQKVNG